ncbi:hypothetical protein [Streptomyces chiangmaiensis]|uniref:hypothetical protein n=1 Tax=Streptomyces chiangmaiensis TaxID=766497 RepID=UPI0038B4933A
MARGRGTVDETTLKAARAAGVTDAEIAAVIGNLALRAGGIPPVSSEHSTPAKTVTGVRHVTASSDPVGRGDRRRRGPYRDAQDTRCRAQLRSRSAKAPPYGARRNDAVTNRASGCRAFSRQGRQCRHPR